MRGCVTNMLNVCGCERGEGWAICTRLMLEGLNKVKVGGCDWSSCWSVQTVWDWNGSVAHKQGWAYKIKLTVSNFWEALLCRKVGHCSKAYLGGTILMKNDQLQIFMKLSQASRTFQSFNTRWQKQTAKNKIIIIF